MGLHESVWVCVGLCRSVWVCVGLCWSVWVCMGLHESVWVCVGLCGSAWVCTYLHTHFPLVDARQYNVCRYQLDMSCTWVSCILQNITKHY